MKEQRLKQLFHLYISRSCTAQEETEFMQLLNDPTLEKTKNELIEEAYDQLPEQYLMTDAQGDSIFQRLLGKQAPVITMQPAKKFFSIRHIALAASVILLLGIGSYFIFFNKQTKPDEIVKTQGERFKNDLKPGVDGAILKIAGGKMIVLDTAADGSLVMQSNTQVRKVKGMLVYQPENSASPKQEVVYNTLETPKGRKYKLGLPDGTNVWLDAASSITFPTMFTGNDRKVEITGQVYFEVRKDKEHPFKVNVAGKGEIEVLGTHFNVNAYDNEGLIKTTLLEGSVKMTKGDKSVIIKPGEQAQITNDIKVVKDVNVDEVVAWKDGFFNFKDADIEAIMRQVERWYDVEVVYESKTTQAFVAEIPRTVNASDFFRILEATGWVHFRIDGKKVVVMK